LANSKQQRKRHIWFCLGTAAMVAMQIDLFIFIRQMTVRFQMSQIKEGFHIQAG
jgi:hypothetical protein